MVLTIRMKRSIRGSIFLAGLMAILAIGATAQQVKRPDFDVTNYVMNVELSPVDNKLTATVDVTFRPLEDLRSVSFELNGSLKVASIARVAQSAAPAAAPAATAARRQPTPTSTPAGPQVTFIQDQVGVSDLGPSVRVDLGATVARDTPVTLQFKYSGILNTPSGGPLLNKRLAYVGENQGYLLYAARWFPFHDYAADLATSDITVTLPGGLQMVGASDTAVAPAAGRFRFTQSKPGLVGNLAYGRFASRSLRFGEYEIQFHTKPGATEMVESYGETLGRALDYYTKQYGEPAMGTRLIVAQIDDESLSLTFEQTASLLRAPANLDDQSVAYQYIMFGKGPMVLRLLEDTIGKAKFDQLLRTFLNEFRGKNASIDDFERLTSRIAGQNMRYFFARWVESTGVPEFTADYVILRTRAGKFVARGTVKQNYDNLRLPVEVQLRYEGDDGYKTVQLQMGESSADFNIEADGKPLEIIIDPGFKLLRISPDLRVTSIARRGIEQFKEGNYVEAQAQFEAALKLDRSNSWIYYHLGLLFLEQRNYDLAKDNFRAALAGNLSPSWLRVWSEIRLGNAYDAQGDRTRATAAYTRAQNLGDNYDDAQEAVKKFQATPYDPREERLAIHR
jgi:aminopeptidase N